MKNRLFVLAISVMSAVCSLAQTVDTTTFDTQQLQEVVVKAHYAVRNAKGYRVNILAVPVFRNLDCAQIISSLPGLAFRFGTVSLCRSATAAHLCSRASTEKKRTATCITAPSTLAVGSAQRAFHWATTTCWA